MRHPSLDCEGGGEGEQLCPGPRKTLTEFTEPGMNTYLEDSDSVPRSTSGTYIQHFESLSRLTDLRS